MPENNTQHSDNDFPIANLSDLIAPVVLALASVGSACLGAYVNGDYHRETFPDSQPKIQHSQPDYQTNH